MLHAIAIVTSCTDTSIYSAFVALSVQLHLHNMYIATTSACTIGQVHLVVINMKHFYCKLPLLKSLQIPLNVYHMWSSVMRNGISVLQTECHIQNA